VVVRHRSSGGDTLLDCYSKPDGVTWQPTCREVQRQDR
jgi:hypothetical protein